MLLPAFFLPLELSALAAARSIAGGTGSTPTLQPRKPMHPHSADPDPGLGGLSSAEAAARLAACGPNQLRPRRHRLALLQWLSRLGNPLVLVLLAAAGVSALGADPAAAAVIVLIVLASVSLDFLQEHRAGQAAQRLADQVAVTASVLRDGRVQAVALADIVPGDLVLLRAGDLVPADGMAVELDNLFVNQAQLTGEPYPVERRIDRGHPPGAWDAEAAHALFMGSSVLTGSARMLVARTGADTALGQVAGALDRAPPPTAFEVGTRRFGLLILRLTIGLVLFVLLVDVVLQRPLLESFLFAVALAVGLTPELLPMIVSVTLARGALRMAGAQVIVKRLSAIQDMGAMDLLCTDKTGTLTEARIRLERHVDPQGRDSARLLELAYLNSLFESGLRSPLDEAILQHRAGGAQDWRKLDEVPFDFERRRISVLLERGQRRLLVVKGAPEDVLALCKRYEGEGGEPLPLDAAARRRIDALFESYGDQGLRVLGVGWRDMPREQVHAVVGDEADLVFAGFAAFLDPPKPGAARALAALEASGVSLKILTGDNERVTRHVCGLLGIRVRGVLTGHDIASMHDDALRARLARVNLVCRADPAQKNRVLLALKARGHVVGYLGDGINDAPALHTADVGISVQGAVDVARQAAALILLRNDLSVLHAAIVEGRRTFGNVMKYIMMATSSNFGNMFSMAAAALLLPFLPMLPLQVLLNNLLYDISELALPLDHVDAEDLARPRSWDMDFVRDFMLSIGPVSSLFDLLTFYLLLRWLHADAAMFHTGWFVESLATQVLVIFVIRTRRSPWRSRPQRALALLAVAVVALAVLLPYTPLAPALGLVALPVGYLALLAPLVGCYLLLVEVAKRAFYRWHAARGRRRPRR